MMRAGSWSVLVALIVCAVGWSADHPGIFEVFRLLGVGCLAVALALLIVGYLRTPDPGRN